MARTSRTCPITSSSSNVIEELFRETAGRYTPNQAAVSSLWFELHKAYTSGGRHYHNLTHLEHLLRELTAVKASIEQWDDVVFAAFYHDAVYSARANDNEEKSAVMAEQRLASIKYSAAGIEHCTKLILATKGHSRDSDSDINHFTDADLSILGGEEAAYDDYARNVRKEYSIYPDMIYKPGRRKVLQHFLAMPKIFKTDLFFDRYEAAARKNLRRGLEILS